MPDYDALGADLIFAAREVRMSPGKVGAAGQWRALAQELVRRGWVPPENPQSLVDLHARAALSADPPQPEEQP
jgi:hypothetical protein